MIDGLIKRVTEKTGLGPDKAKAAVECVLARLKEKLPAPLASSLESYVSGAKGTGQTAGEGLGNLAGGALGNIFGKKS